MRILAITNRYPRPGHELIAPYNRQQFRALAQQHELRVVAPVPWTDKFKDAVRLRSVPCQYTNQDGIGVEHPTYFFPPRMLAFRWDQFYLRSVRGTVRRLLDEFRPQVLLGCWAHPDGWAVVQLAREAGLPVVIKVIGSDVLVLTRHQRRRERIAEALREADAVVAVSQHLAECVVRLGVQAQRVHVVSEGVDRDLFRPGDQGEARARLGLPAAGQLLLFVGNLLLSKGAGVLLEACALLQNRGPAFRCVLIGQGHDEATLRALVARHGLGGVVTLAGACPQERLPDWYRACDLVALPSFSEGIPNVLREAMMCGKPFVATRVGGIPEVTPPGIGTLVEPGDVTGLAEALHAALKAPAAVDRAVVLAGNCSWDHSAHLLAERLEAVVASRIRATVQRDAGRAPLRILALTNRYPRLGHETIAPFNRYQFRALAQHHELHVVAPVPWTDNVKELARLDPRLKHYLNQDGIWVDHPNYLFPPKIMQHRYGRFYLRSVRRTVRRLLRKFRPQVLLGCWAHPDGWAAVQLAREAGLPVVVKVHGSDVLVLTQNRRRRERIAEALREADGVIAVSQDLADHVIQLGVDPGKVHVIYNGVDGDLFQPGDQGEARARLGLPAAGQLLLFVGNLLLSKGAGVLLEACALLQNRGPAFRCVLVGQGHDEATLRALVARHGLGGVVTLAGACPQERLPDWYRACDLVALPSFSEGIPNVLREAMMCGKPFVATRVGGIPEVTPPGIGTLVEPGDVTGLAEALHATLKAPAAVDRAVALAGNCSWDHSAHLLAECLEAVVESRRRLLRPALAGAIASGSG